MQLSRANRAETSLDCPPKKETNALLLGVRLFFLPSCLQFSENPLVDLVCSLRLQVIDDVAVQVQRDAGGTVAQPL